MSANYQEREDDIVWKVRFNDEWIYLYLLLEFQSDVDKFMAVRLMTYLGLLYEDLIKSKKLPKGRKLPPVLPWVIYTGSRRWTAPLESQELLDRRVPKLLKTYFPQFKYYMLDMGHYFSSGKKLPKRSLISPLIELETRVSNWSEASPIVEQLMKQLQAPKFASLRRAFAVHIRRVLKLESPEEDDRTDLEEVNSMLAERIDAYERQLKKKCRQEGQKEKAISIACRMYKNGYSADAIVQLTDISFQELQDLVEKMELTEA